jgi:hypothetical protein
MACTLLFKFPYLSNSLTAKPIATAEVKNVKKRRLKGVSI